MTDEPARPPHTLDEELLEAETPTVVTTESDASRIARVHQELADGFGSLGHVGPAVSIFGSARTPPEHAYYGLARETAKQLGDAGFTIITGGGPGIMEAANRGATEAGVESIGLDIDLLGEGMNAFVTRPLFFHYFFVRKVMFVRYASAFVVFPGGFGTLDELFEALTLIQTDKIHSFPVVLMGTEYWQGLIDWLRDPVLESQHNISPGDMELFELCDDPARVVEVVAAAQHRTPRLGD